MRKTIARRLTESKQQVPHIYLTVDIQLDALLKLRGELNAGLESRGVKLSVNDLLIKALAQALIEVPECNVSFAGDQLLKYSRADISVAVSIPAGLITPIIVGADTKSVSAISTEMKDLAGRAKEGKLQPQEYQGGTASLSQHGHVRDQAVRSRHQPAAGHDHGDRRGREAALRHQRQPADRDRDERHRQLRPPRHRRRRRREADAGVQAAGRKPAGDAGLSREAVIRVTAMPADTNPYGGVFGGWLMGQMGLACGSFASRRTQGKAILVAADAIKFPGAMAVGDELSVYVELLKQGRTSLRLEGRSDRARARRGAAKRSWRRASSPSSRWTRRASRGRSPVPSPSPLAGEGGARSAQPSGRGVARDERSAARELRDSAKCAPNPTPAEQRLWSMLRDRATALLQVQAAARHRALHRRLRLFRTTLIIEADGGQHAESA